MAEDLSELVGWADALIAKLDDAGRRALTKQVGIEIARSQRRRIAQQQNPDGSAFATRKPKAQARRGSIRRKTEGPMFRRLRTPKFLRMENDASEARIGFTGVAARIAGVHQEGGSDRVGRRPGSPIANYAKRELLGLTAEERGRIMDIVLEHLGT